jgi:hypothetical protein
MPPSMDGGGARLGPHRTQPISPMLPPLPAVPRNLERPLDTPFPRKAMLEYRDCRRGPIAAFVCSLGRQLPADNPAGSIASGFAVLSEPADGSICPIAVQCRNACRRSGRPGAGAILCAATRLSIAAARVLPAALRGCHARAFLRRGAGSRGRCPLWCDRRQCRTGCCHRGGGGRRRRGRAPRGRPLFGRLLLRKTLRVKRMLCAAGVSKGESD